MEKIKEGESHQTTYYQKDNIYLQNILTKRNDIHIMLLSKS